MAFPTSPIDGQSYTNALGTQYRYVLADTAWKIVSGSGGGSGMVGPGTVGTLAMFNPDTTSVGNSNLTQDSDGQYLNKNSVVVDNLYGYGVVSATSNGITKSYVKTVNSNGYQELLSLQAFGGNITDSTSGPDGTTTRNGVQIESTGANWFNIHTLDQVATGHLSNRWKSKLSWDRSGIHIHDTLSMDQSGMSHNLTSILPSNVYFCVDSDKNIPDYSGGSPIITGIAAADGCTDNHPGIIIRGLFSSTSPDDYTPAIKLIGGKSNGFDSYTNVHPAETVLEVMNGATSTVKITGDGDIASIPQTDYASTSVIKGWDIISTKELFFKKLGNTVYCSLYITGDADSTSSNTTFTLPFSATTFSNIVLGFSKFYTTRGTDGTWGIGTVGYDTDGTFTLLTYPGDPGWGTGIGTSKSVTSSFFFESASL